MMAEILRLGATFLACAGGIIAGFRIDDWIVARRRQRWNRASVDDYLREDKRPYQ